MKQDEVEHDEANCEGLHIEAGFQSVAYGISKGSLAFKHWFETIFTFQNPQAAQFYEMELDKLEGAQVIGVTSFNSTLTVEVLEMLFECSRTDDKNTLTLVKN